MAAGGGICWGIFRHDGAVSLYARGKFYHVAHPDPLSLAGLLFAYWLVKDRKLLAPWRQCSSAVMLVLYGVSV